MNIAATITDGRDHTAPRREELHDDDVGPILQEVEAGQHSEWVFADHSFIDQSYWAQWNSLVGRDSVLEYHWESTDGRSRTVQIVLPQSQVKEVLKELHGPWRIFERTSECQQNPEQG
jgi:hypothetical protein